jgi:hypothetical protein
VASPPFVQDGDEPGTQTDGTGTRTTPQMA